MAPKDTEVEPVRRVPKFTKDEIDQGVPEEVPSITEIKKSLPAKCFSPDLTTSFYYVFKDLAIVIALYLTMLVMELQPYPWLKYIYAPIYWYIQGTMMAAVFCVGHDCGHESFSNSALINDIVGNFMHTIIMVPYYPWKLTHRHHHKNTGNIDKDEIFYPTRTDNPEKDKVFLIPYFGLGIGWIAYLIRGYNPRAFSHFNPFTPILARHALKCIISMSCMAAWTLLVVVPYGQTYGLSKLAVHYLMPVGSFACWIVFITFLHHHDEKLPWYADHKWDFVRGQLSSVDRNYGWAHEYLHNIGTHQIHHLFTKVPHYHLEEATKVFRETYPQLVRKSDERLIPAFMRMFHLYNDQCYISQDKEVHSYKPGGLGEKSKVQ